MSTNQSFDEKELFARIANGDEAALNTLYEQLRPRMEGYALKLMKTEEAVMDVLQESMIRLWLNREKLSEVDYPTSWFFKIIANECFRYLRRYGLSGNSSLLPEPDQPMSRITDRDLATIGGTIEGRSRYPVGRLTTRGPAYRFQ